MTREWLRRDWLREQVASMRIGLTSLRPFGSSAAKQSLASQSMGARISTAPKNQGHKKIPLQGVYYRVKVWFEHQYSLDFEPRPTTIRTRCELELATEIGTQRALERLKPELFQDYVLASATHRLQWLQAKRGTKTCQKWINERLLPAIGGRRRYGQKFNIDKNPPNALKCELQWQTVDYASWLVLNGNQEDLAPLVQDPEQFIASRHETLIVQTDATAVWVKLRGEEPRVIPETVLHNLQGLRAQTRRFRQRARHVTPEERELLEYALKSHAQTCDDLKAQVDQQFSQGGDKQRLTLILQGVTVNWYSIAKEPQGYLMKIKLLYKCSHVCRLEYITDQHTWAVTHQYVDSLGNLQTRTKGQATGGLLRWWVEFRKREPDCCWKKRCTYECLGILGKLRILRNTRNT